MMSSDEKAAFLNILINCVTSYVGDTETSFRITFLQNDDSAEAIRRLNSGFSWVKANQYSLLALLNFVKTWTNQSTTSKRASSKELRDMLNAIINHDSNKPILQVMKTANPDQPTWDPLTYFQNLCQAVTKDLILQIMKTHLDILLHYSIFQLEARLTSLQANISQMLLGLKSKEDAKKTHKLRENALEASTEFLKLNNPALQAFIRTIFPTTTVTNTFCYDTFKSSLMGISSTLRLTLFLLHAHS